jgi:hypothetical protein
MRIRLFFRHMPQFMFVLSLFSVVLHFNQPSHMSFSAVPWMSFRATLWQAADTIVKAVPAMIPVRDANISCSARLTCSDYTTTCSDFYGASCDSISMCQWSASNYSCIPCASGHCHKDNKPCSQLSLTECYFDNYRCVYNSNTSRFVFSFPANQLILRKLRGPRVRCDLLQPRLHCAGRLPVVRGRRLLLGVRYSTRAALCIS